MIHRIDFRAMGCQMMAALEYPSSRAEQLLKRVPEWFETWEASLSRFRPESELSRLNDAPGEMMQVSETLWKVFQTAQAAYEDSGGLVTPTVLHALVAAGYISSFDPLKKDQTEAPGGIGNVLPLETVETWPERRALRLPAGLGLDFGGAAKGWAAHEAMMRLANYGPALVNAGGDIAISGLGAEAEPWLVGIDDPFQPGQSLGTLRLGRSGVATSGLDYRHWKLNGSWKHHLIDPHTGEPAVTDLISATVIAPTVMKAEMAAKVLLISGSREGENWLRGHPNLAGLMVTEIGRLITNPAFEKHLRSTHNEIYL
jgi:thiamine biosynthesis lipoprotein